MNHSSFLKSSVALVALSCALPTIALAQDAGASSGDIIVTAQKRAQLLSDVPVTVMAATGEQLQSAGVVDVNQLAKVTPSFAVGAAVYGYQSFSIRGVNFNSSQVSAAPAVSAYQDEAILPYSAMTGAMLLDAERIEVLKGPQGILFGQNATGGSINVIAAKPTEQQSAGIRTEVDHFGQVMLEGFVSGPITENLRARIAASTTQGGGYQKGFYLTDRDNGSQNKAAVRLLLDWTPTDKLKVAVNLNANYDRGEVVQPKLGIVDIAAPAFGGPAGLNGYLTNNTNNNRDVDIHPGFDTNADKKMYQGVVRVDYDLSEFATITSITNYASFRAETPINYSGNATNDATTNVFGEVDAFSQELRVAGSVYDSKVTYVVGANYSNDDIRDGQTSNLNDYSGTAFLPGPAYTIDYKLKNKSKAIFGNVDYEFIPQWTLTGGLRYTELDESIYGCVFGNGSFNALLAGIGGALRAANGFGPAPAGAWAPDTCGTVNDVGPNPDYLPAFTDRKQKEHNTSFRGGLSYKPDRDALLYATVTRGYKAGVFPAQPNLLESEAQPVKQEELTSYEVGAKFAAFDRTLRVNASAFFYDYKDKQVYTYFPLPAPLAGVSSYISNVPKSEIRGFDVDASWTPIENFTLRGAVTYLDSEAKAFAAFDGNGVIVEANGKDLPFAPKWSGNVDAEYRMDLNDALEAYLGGSLNYTDSSFQDLAEQPKGFLPSYTTIDLRLGVNASAGWNLGVFARNITDKDYWTSSFKAGDEYSRYMGTPRTYGVVAGYRF